MVFVFTTFISNWILLSFIFSIADVVILIVAIINFIVARRIVKKTEKSLSKEDLKVLPTFEMPKLRQVIICLCLCLFQLAASYFMLRHFILKHFIHEEGKPSRK